MLQAVGSATRVTDDAPTGHIAESPGRHVAVLALQGQRAHARAQHRLLRQLLGQEATSGLRGRGKVGARWGPRGSSAAGETPLARADLKQEEVVIDGVGTAVRVGH